MRGALARLILQLAALLPLPVVQSLGAGLGLIAYLVPNELRAATLDNLRLCFADMPDRERKRMARRSLQELGKTLLEMGPLWIRDPGRISQLVRKTHGLEHVDAAMARGEGLVLIGPHLGNWELVGLEAARLRDRQLTSMYRPLRESALEDLVRRSRERTGARLVTATATGVKELYQALNRNEMVGILPDQRPKEATAGVMAPFFDVPCPTGTLIPRLLRKSGAAALFVFGKRLPRGSGFELHLIPPPEGLTDPDPTVAARALNAGIEACIAICPEQYLWSYRRFTRAIYRELHEPH
jgi:KDO2-lipid IV(A) lauroyltransferase